MSINPQDTIFLILQAVGLVEKSKIKPFTEKHESGINDLI